jgi:hypothetical protein
MDKPPDNGVIGMGKSLQQEARGMIAKILLRHHRAALFNAGANPSRSRSTMIDKGLGSTSFF